MHRGDQAADLSVAATTPTRSSTMSKRARKRRDRKKNKANHGRKPNA